MNRDHYVVLGISRYETEGGIHAAFRVLAKRYHPDVAGSEASGRFREVVEAYEVLSDPERRRRYDEGLAPPVRSAERRRTDLRVPASRPEPLIPEPLSIASDFELIRPSRSDLLERLRRNFFGLAPKGERLEPLNVVVVLPREQALVGGTITVGVPVYFHCPHCRGTGRDWISDCLHCDGTGEMSVDKPVQLDVPPFTGTRAVLDVPLHQLGVRNFFLRLQLQVAS
jgi:DnaJ-class molecular chaperone